jgi:predicted aspartyl protease
LEALVDTGFNAPVVLPTSKLARPLLGLPEATLGSGAGQQMPTKIIEQEIVFAGTSRNNYMWDSRP